MDYQRDILDAIRRILKSLRESSRFAENQLGLSGAQLLILQFLKPGRPLTVNELAKRTQTHQSSVSVVVSRLAEAKLVTRQSSLEDGRKVEIVLTTQGSHVLKKKAPPLAQERLFDAIASLTPSKQKQLSALLTEVVELAGFDSQTATLFFEDDVKGKKK